MDNIHVQASSYQLWLKARCIWAEEQFDGRLNRLGFLWRTLLIAVLWLGALFAANALAAIGQIFLSWVVEYVPYIPLVIIQASCIARRLHDMNRPAMHFWLLIIPLYNVYLVLLLVLKKGTTGDNQYGPDPKA